MMHAFYTEPQARKRSFSLPIGFVLIGVLSIAVVILFLGIGRWLTIEDPLEKAQAIVVLSGRMPIRAIEAARLYHAGYASQIWLTRPSEPAESLQAMHIAYIGEDFYNTRVLMHAGVPEKAIRVLDPPIANTVDEVHVVARELLRQTATTVILVTTKAHTRRVRTLWRKIADPRGRAIVRASQDDSFQPARWWRSSSDALDVVREVLGLLNVWAGLPLRPST
jgi:uncharacterized SAM-binding protein YcdF (DUF218 family)